MMAVRRRTVVESPNDLGDACEAVDRAAREAGFDARESYACQLAVCEAAENIFAHGYTPGNEGPIRMTITSAAGRLQVLLVDDAPPFNPAIQEPEPPTPLGDPPSGGLGMYIIHKVMDEIRYERRKGQNRLTLAKQVGRSSRS